MFEKHLPFFTHAGPNEDAKINPLDLVEPGDLQKFGLIPEFTGRVPVSVALSALDEDALVRVLTEPRNSLVKQYEQIFQLSGIEIRFTSGALREIAKSALGMGTGARGLRTCIERLLSEAMFEAPGKLSDRSETKRTIESFGSTTTETNKLSRFRHQTHPNHSRRGPAQRSPNIPGPRPAAPFPHPASGRRGRVGSEPDDHRVQCF